MARIPLTKLKTGLNSLSALVQIVGRGILTGNCDEFPVEIFEHGSGLTVRSPSPIPLRWLVDEIKSRNCDDHTTECEFCREDSHNCVYVFF